MKSMYKTSNPHDNTAVNNDTFKSDEIAGRNIIMHKFLSYLRHMLLSMPFTITKIKPTISTPNTPPPATPSMSMNMAFAF